MVAGGAGSAVVECLAAQGHGGPILQPRHSGPIHRARLARRLPGHGRARSCGRSKPRSRAGGTSPHGRPRPDRPAAFRPANALDPLRHGNTVIPAPWAAGGGGCLILALTRPASGRKVPGLQISPMSTLPKQRAARHRPRSRTCRAAPIRAASRSTRSASRTCITRCA